MIKKFLTILAILPLVAFCAPQNNPEQEPENQEEQNPEDNPEEQEPEVDPYEKAAPEVKDGETVLATNPLIENFLTAVEYKDYPEDKLETTRIFEFPGGFGGPDDLNWNNWETEWPDGDKPCQYSIRWKKEDLEDGTMTLHLEDKLGWSGEMDVKAGSLYVDITNLVPNDDYNYKVSAASGKVLAQGSFKTTGHLHHLFFTGPTSYKKIDGVKTVLKGSGCRNGRDLGGWEGLGGKHVKYRKAYRGGRMNEKWTPYPLNKQGEKEVLFEGIKAEIDLRGTDDIIYEPAVAGLDHWHGIIEEGGKCMLGVTNPSNYNCAKWLAFDVQREDMKNKSKDDLKKYEPTPDELEAFKVAYQAKMKDLLTFVFNCAKDNKPVYFHCSLGRDRTGTLDVTLLGLLGVKEGVIAREYEVTYFAPVGYCVSSSDKVSNPQPIFKNTRKDWVYSDIVPYFWGLSTDGTFVNGVENYVKSIGITDAEIAEFRSNMLE